MRRPAVIIAIVVGAFFVLVGSVATGVTIGFGLYALSADGDGGERGRGSIVEAVPPPPAEPDPEVSALPPPIEADEDFGTVEVYTVLPDGQLDPPPTGNAAYVWSLYLDMVGAEMASSSVYQFRVANTPDADVLAYVIQQRDPQYWNLVVNLDFVDDRELLAGTLAHEHAHIVAYNVSQFDGDPVSCDTFQTYEGCVLPNAYLWAFYQEFWSGYASHPGLENVDQDVAYDFYEQHEDDFVSAYAATNIGEDFAESFMTFVLEDSSSASTVTGAKLQFFTRYPELVELRKQMRSAFDARW